MIKAPPDIKVTVWIRLMRAQTKALSAIEADLKSASLPVLAWYDVLLELRRAADIGLRPFELESRLLLAQHNVSRLLDRMEAKGLIERKAFEGDGRGLRIVISKAGRDLQKHIAPIYQSALEKFFSSKLNEAEATKLAELLALLD